MRLRYPVWFIAIRIRWCAETGFFARSKRLFGAMYASSPTSGLMPAALHAL